ncbi:MAG: hypothetical protein LUH22_16170 [Bacteroides sp.]|nr:hypothetical protein [Bacteroides sp.]
MKYIDLKKILYMDSLIQRKCTGSPDRFARKIELSRSALFEYLAYMRNELMLDIVYNNYSETYSYEGKDLSSVLGNMRCIACQEKLCLEFN